MSCVGQNRLDWWFCHYDSVERGDERVRDLIL